MRIGEAAMDREYVICMICGKVLMSVCDSRDLFVRRSDSV